MGWTINSLCSPERFTSPYTSVMLVGPPRPCVAGEVVWLLETTRDVAPFRLPPRVVAWEAETRIEVSMLRLTIKLVHPRDKLVGVIARLPDLPRALEKQWFSATFGPPGIKISADRSLHGSTLT